MFESVQYNTCKKVAVDAKFYQKKIRYNSQRKKNFFVKLWFFLEILEKKNTFRQVTLLIPLPQSRSTYCLQE